MASTEFSTEITVPTARASYDRPLRAAKSITVATSWWQDTTSWSLQEVEASLIGKFEQEKRYIKMKDHDYYVQVFMGDSLRDDEIFIYGQGCTLILSVDFVSGTTNAFPDCTLKIVYRNCNYNSTISNSVEIPLRNFTGFSDDLFNCMIGSKDSNLFL